METYCLCGHDREDHRDGYPSRCLRCSCPIYDDSHMTSDASDYADEGGEK